MKFGIATFVDDDTIDAVTLARAIEDRGFASLMVAEHKSHPGEPRDAVPHGR